MDKRSYLAVHMILYAEKTKHGKKKLLSILNGPEIALMGSLQISTRSALGTVVHAAGLWP